MDPSAPHTYALYASLAVFRSRIGSSTGSRIVEATACSVRMQPIVLQRAKNPFSRPVQILKSWSYKECSIPTISLQPSHYNHLTTLQHVRYPRRPSIAPSAQHSVLIPSSSHPHPRPNNRKAQSHQQLAHGTIFAMTHMPSCTTCLRRRGSRRGCRAFSGCRRVRR